MKITIRKKVFEQEFFEEKLNESKSYSTFAKSLGWGFCNGSLTDDLKDAVEKLNLNIDHFFLGKPRQYPLVKKNCPICGVEFETSEGIKKEKTTCSSKCSNTYFSTSKHTEEANLKRSIKSKENAEKVRSDSYYKHDKYQEIYFLYGLDVFKNTDAQDEELLTKKQSARPKRISKIEEYECLFCKSKFTQKSSRKKQNYCSKECVSQCPIHKDKLRQLALERVANGTHKGWAKRDNLEPSYPEKYIMKLITELGYTLQLTDGYICNKPVNSNNIILTRESKVSKWFIDFADLNKKLALEIDGKQHNLPDRKASDKIKDDYLINEGWEILRIKWRKIDLAFRNELIGAIKLFFKCD